MTEYRHPPIDDIAEQVARYVAEIIEDGATLQIDLGRIPNEALKHLKRRRNLGIHSNVITEGVLDLIKTGVITGAQKTLHPGRVVASFCLGTRELYDFIHDNPLFEFRPIEYVADPAIVARNHAMVSLSQAFAIDLTGQVCADQFQPRAGSTAASRRCRTFIVGLLGLQVANRSSAFARRPMMANAAGSGFSYCPAKVSGSRATTCTTS